LWGSGSECRLVGFATVVSYAGDHLRKAVIETAGPSGATLKLLTEAREKMELSEAGDQSEDNQQGRARKLAARCWAMLLARIYECLPLTCQKCGQPMRLIAFIMEPVVVEKILSQIGEPTEPPAVFPARALLPGVPPSR
jgi:hypothetical protein